VARYNGDGNYLPSTSDAATPNVPCDRTITGTYSSLTLTMPGSVCVLDAHITGGISASKGVVLDVENSTVSGSISTNGAAGVRICGSSTGTIVITKSTGFVLVGDPANNCPANTVAGSILATSNTNGLVIVGNTVSGTVTASGNSGAGPLAVYPGPIVSGNHH
jgi:5'-nucleotidase